MLPLPFDALKIADICRNNDVSSLCLFGSYARNEETAKSDIDLLVEFSKPKSLFALVRLERILSAAIGKKVDLITKASLSPNLRDRILNKLRTIFEA